MNQVQKKKDKLRWLYPLLQSVIIFNVLRAVTDLPLGNRFWGGDTPYLHIIELLFIIPICYVADFIWRKQLQKKDFSDRKQSIMKEYAVCLLQIVIITNLYMFGGEASGLLYIGNGIIDYILVNAIFIPFQLLYYTFIRTKIMHEHYTRQQLELEELEKVRFKTELDFLKAQYHPHFLFNALNTIYFQIDPDNTAAKESIELLSGLLRYQLYDIQQKVTIEKEIEYLRSYIQFQQLRTSDKLKLELYIDPALRDIRIHPLLFQPLVENAFKYVRGDYRITIRLSAEDDKVVFYIRNTTSERKDKKQKAQGIGLTNLHRRLELLYPNKHDFETEKQPDAFIARLTIQV